MQPAWLNELKSEIDDDRRMLADFKNGRVGSEWSYTKAVERTQAFYRQRIRCFADSGTISTKQRDQLLSMVDHMPDTPREP